MYDDGDGTGETEAASGRRDDPSGSADPEGGDSGSVDERVRRVEATGRELESGAVPSTERADRIAEDKRLVADLERGLETPAGVEESFRTGP